jgi:hypothetical protein
MAKSKTASDDDRPVKDLIPAKLKRSKSYASDYEDKTFGEIRKLASGHPPDQKARQMKKLVEQRNRLVKKLKGKGK